MKQVKDAMSALNAMVGPEHTLRQASEKMVQHKTGAAVVMDHGLPGPCVITERDLLKAIAAGMDVDTEVVGALFLIESGECVAGPCAGESLAALACREQDGGIWVTL